MTATDELRKLLDERGVEWEAYDEFELTTQWETHEGAFVYWARERDGKLLVETTAPTKCSLPATPDQAVAATLGKESDDAAMLKLHDLMNATLLEYERALGGEKTDGAITVPFVAEMHHLLEEAATLGTGTCHNTQSDFDFMCSECGKCVDNGRVLGFNFCPNCGRRIVEMDTCKADETETWDCVCDNIGHYGARLTVHVMECSECGHTYEHVNGSYEYCPWCGRRIKDDE